jgi:hypothetical protein
MIRTFLSSAALVLLALALPSQVHAYGAYHSGYTTSGPGGVQHYGSTSAVGPYGGSVQHTGSTTATPYGVQHTGSTTGTGAYGGSFSSSSSQVYSPTMHSGYSAVGVSGGGYSAGVVNTGYAYR